MNTDNEKPKVSVLMPVYNGEKTLRYALASLIYQTYENWICVIVNDGSTDSTKEILDSLTDSRFHIYHLDRNYGRGIARDEALKHAEGKYLAFLDADDIMHRNKLKMQVEYLESRSEIMLCSCDFVTISESLNVLRACKNNHESDNTFRYGQVLPLLLPAVMVRLDHAIKFHYNHNLDVGEDYDFFARCCDGYKYGNVDGYLYYYMMNNTTARKLLYYQFNSMNTYITEWKYGLKFTAFKGFIIRCLKILIYFVLLPILGANKLTVNRYGHKLPHQSIIDEYHNELAMIKKVIQNNMQR